MTKPCFRCGTEKPLDSFYRHKRMADGHLNKCIECAKSDVMQNRASRRKQYSDYEARRQQDPERRASKQGHCRRHQEVHPDRHRARCAVRNAVTRGALLRGPCQRCGASKVQAHHKDYSRPLDVEWLCFRCHREHAHGQVVVAQEKMLPHF